MVSRRTDLTFRENLNRGRHGWVRLTPAYSVKIVQEILDENPGVHYVLDPFSGTGTTGLVCGMAGVRCDLVDINPFLVWLARVKTANYTPDQLAAAQEEAAGIVEAAKNISDTAALWAPPISNINRWWAQGRLTVLAKLFHTLNQHCPDDSPARDLLLVAFCRTLIRWSNAAFNHQSMSFKDEGETLFTANEEDLIYDTYRAESKRVVEAASQRVPGQVAAFERDSRCLQAPDGDRYDGVITSPPYPNRMSYIRELRPYMYWLGYLKEAREAGELDWRAIGGTWGIATSRLADWRAGERAVQMAEILEVVRSITRRSPLLANYVHKYFVDMTQHFASLRGILAPGGHLFYIIGNSKFYDTLVPAETIYTRLLEQEGFTEIAVETIRKRNSKKELFEFLVSARKPLA